MADLSKKYTTISEAVATVIPKIGKIANKGTMAGGSQRFRFAKTDDIYAACRVELAKVGLTVIADQKKPKILSDDKSYKDSKTKEPVLTGQFTFNVGFSMGDQEELETMTFFVRITGPQTTAALRSYAIKYFLRGKLLLETGESVDEEDQLEGNGNPFESPDMPPKKATKQKPSEDQKQRIQDSLNQEI